jgi:hypothetical protein
MDFWIIKLSVTGNIQWLKCLGSTSQDVAYAVQQTTDGGFILGGYTSAIVNDGDVTGNHGGADFWVVKLGSKTAVDNIDKEAISILPSPVSDILYINGMKNGTIKIYNISGQLIKQAENINNISVSECPSGLYFVQLINDIGYPIYQDKIIKN